MKRLERDERGVSVVVGAILVFGISIAVGSIAYSQYAEGAISSTESAHANGVKDKFLRIGSALSNLNEEGESFKIQISLKADSPRFVAYTPGLGDARVVEGLSKRHFIPSITKEAPLRSEDGEYYTTSPVVLVENFFSTDDWKKNIKANDNDTYSTPGFDPLQSSSRDGSGSIHLAANATVGGDREDDSGSENAIWEKTLEAPATGENITVRAEYMVYISARKDPLTSAEVENSKIAIILGSDDSETTIESEQLNDSTNGFEMFSESVTDLDEFNRIKIRMKEKVKANSPFPFFFGASIRANLWLDDIVVINGPPYVAEDTNRARLSRPNYIDNIKIRTVFRTEVNPGVYALQVLDNGGGKEEWDELREERIKPSDGKVIWSGWIGQGGKLQDLDNYLIGESRNKIKVRLRGENEESFLRLSEDYVGMPQINYMPEVQDQYSYSGSFQVGTTAGTYPAQTFAYMDGAVILCQDNRSVMLDPPDMLSVENREDDDIEVRVRHYVLDIDEKVPSQEDWISPVFRYEGSYYSVMPWKDPNREEVMLDLDPQDYEDAWGEYLESKCRTLSERGYNVSYDPEKLKITISGPEDSGKDIYYYERITELSCEF